MLPALAQVAEREGKFLVELFNKIRKHNRCKAFSANGIPLGEPFVYRHLGSKASVGRYKALVDLCQSKGWQWRLDPEYDVLHTLQMLLFNREVSIVKFFKKISYSDINS